MCIDWKVLVVAVVLVAPACGQSEKKYASKLLTILEHTDGRVANATQSRLGEYVEALLDGPLGTLMSALAPSLTQGITTSFPVPPWGCDQIKDKHAEKNERRTPILPPIRLGEPAPLCEETPDDAEVLRALKPAARGIPHFYEEAREDIQIVKERLLDRIDPPRFFPQVGWALLHHCHYKCSIYFTETRQSSYPFPFSVRKPRREIVYIDKDHLHLVEKECSTTSDPAR